MGFSRNAAECPTRAENRSLSLFVFLPPLLFLALVMGLRYGVGADYWAYISIFERLSERDQAVIDRFEPLFVLLVTGLGDIGLKAQHVIFLFYGVTLSFLVAAIFSIRYKAFSMHFLAFVLLLWMGPVLEMTNVVRQSLVVALGAFLVVALLNRRVAGPMVPAILGYGMHYSSPVLAALVAIPRGRVTPLLWWVFSGAGILFYLTAPDFVWPLVIGLGEVFGGFGHYINSLPESRGVTGLGVRLYFEVVLFLVLSFFVSRLPSRVVVLFNCAFVGVILRVAFQDVAVIFRISSYFYVFSFLVLPWFLGAFNGFVRAWYFVFMMLYGGVLFVRNVASPQFSPYQIYVGW